MHRTRRQMTILDELQTAAGVAELTNLRICEEKQPFTPLNCSTTSPNAVEVEESRHRAATDGVLMAGANISPYFKRTTSFRMSKQWKFLVSK
ncbi:hypothetical protein ANCDUO_05859 [Ancylostoma duodenale]|uniref:Uncharacterized protein n=1 Tax=Ancylostoma duodenale TaxID=51022 RepID=A0A0C2DMI8_9BILA|nr:hypothetical protein ANCDUO_05859 [Ancylostoma duodenale]